MKTSSTFVWSIGLLLANTILWIVLMALYLSQHPEVIEYNVGVA